MKKNHILTEIIVNVHSLEKRVAVLEENKLVELFVEKQAGQNLVGNIYKGIVKDVLPGMGAAFIDIGLERTAFLHYTDIVLDFLDIFDKDQPRQHIPKGDSSKITQVLKPGQEIVVQIHKGPIGSKGARLTGQISIPGKYLVFFPNKSKIAISRKINHSNEKNRIRNILNSFKSQDVGLIVRTEAEGNSEEDFANEYNALAKTWRLIEKQLAHSKPPACVFEENALENYLIRDLFGEHVDRLVIDDKNFARRIVSQLEDIAPELVDKVEVYKEDSPIFDAWAIEKKIETIFHSRVYLPSGGNIRIEQTEAMVSVDVNTGSFTGSTHYSETIKKTNIEAAHEIARQIRLRDLSGVIVVDFIDMIDENHKKEVLDALRSGLNRDRAKNKVYSFTELGLVEVTRKRMRTSLVANYSEPCPHCNGTGKILSRDAVVMRVYRWLSRAEYFIKNDKVRIMVHPIVKAYIEKNKDFFVSFEQQIEFAEDASVRQDSFRVLSLPDEKDITSKYTT